VKADERVREVLAQVQATAERRASKATDDTLRQKHARLARYLGARLQNGRRK
jgi:hypothetical protein